MKLCELTAVTPVDGRYRNKIASLAPYFSEFGLMRYRVMVEIEYFIKLGTKIPGVQQAVDTIGADNLRAVYRDFSLDDARRIKDIERVTNHDVKAVEYFIKEKFDTIGSPELDAVKEFVHFGLTSQDINNTAVPMSIARALKDVYLPALRRLQDKLETLAAEWADVPMLAKTHGQPASPTRLGKEVGVFAYRLRVQVSALEAVPITGKFGGATGNFNAHRVAFPGEDWPGFAAEFLRDELGIEREELTTQISNYDNLAALFDALARINTIILDLDRDFWMYISMEYFKQRIKEGEVGSSAMPHKVNPIDFENSEGNIGMANALLKHLAGKLPVSRLQRDLTDSTVLRNVGVPLAHGLIAIESTLKGLNKLILNRAAIDTDLDNTWAVVAEGIQTILRSVGYPNPYEALKKLTRVNTGVTAQSISKFIDSLDVADNVKQRLHALSPSTYVGF